MEINYQNYLCLKEQGLSRLNIAKIFNIPEWKLKKLIALNKWGTVKPTIENTKAFTEYTSESCYWAGFLAADGNVDEKGRIRIMLKYDDIEHLKKFKEYLKSSHTISTNTIEYNRCSFEFTNKEMCEDLDLNFNIVPRKTSILKFPKFIPDEYLKDFIRGYFDGDGSICESFSNRNSVTATLYATIACGSKEFIHTLFEIIGKNLDLNGHLQEFKDSTKWQIKFNTNDAKTFLTYMYKNSTVYLDRKYLLYKKIVVENDRLIR